MEYRATTAQWHAGLRARRPKPAKLAVNTELRRYVQDRLSGTEDGPAAGWSYFTATAPDEVIAQAPSPPSMRGERWMRVRKVAGPWPGQHLYCRGPLPARDADELIDPDEVLISYRLVRS